ncbi:PucR family transcriptional regulator [Clostridium perfringens]|uniref:PucR family transcriptional regulator n=1 Tax=Clostridium perfringens TaxID=1502 RepID=UPI0039ED4163
MSFCCKDLFQLKYFSKAKLLSGESGLNNQISLPYVRTTESISNWLYGGELLFVIYKDNDENLSLLLEECIQKKLAGIVILIDDKNIDKITDTMVDRANNEALPLFIMPWDIKLIDIIQEIFLKIEQKREESKNGKHFLESLLFSQDQLSDDINALAEFYNIKLRPFHYICILKMRKSSNIPYDTENISKHITNFLDDGLKGKNYTLIHMEYANYLLSLVFANDYEEAKKSLEYIESGFNLMCSRYSENIEMHLSFSRIRETNSDIKASYKEAFKALSMIDMYDNDSKIIKYNELGIIRLFIELAEIKDVEQYCYENIGPILEYDKSHGMNLLETLKCYFKNNRHLLKTSQELFIHRNTLLYRLSTIKNLLQRDLDDAMTDLELFNSILIFEFLNLQNKL